MRPRQFDFPRQTNERLVQRRDGGFVITGAELGNAQRVEKAGLGMLLTNGHHFFHRDVGNRFIRGDGESSYSISCLFRVVSQTHR